MSSLLCPAPGSRFDRMHTGDADDNDGAARLSPRPASGAAEPGQAPQLATMARRFARARDARQTEIAEDYVELIDDLIARDGRARSVDVARALGVSHVTVFKTVSRLQRDGLVTTAPYRSIALTEAGRALAQRARRRHQIVARFLRAIGVDAETAAADAEGMEHHASAATLSAFERMTARLTDRSTCEDGD